MNHRLLEPVSQTLAALQDGRLSPMQASAQLRAQQALLDQLPPRFTEVLHGLLDRLESSALFDGESCSFNASDLHDSLRWWVDKAEQRLAAA